MEDAPILNVPLHIITEVLSYLPTLKDLESSILAHPFFLSALHDAPSLPNHVLRNQFSNDEGFTLALAANESRKHDRHWGNAMTGNTPLRSPDGTLEEVGRWRNLTIAEVKGVLHVHEGVVRMANRMRYFDGYSTRGKDGLRMEKMLYRSEITSNLRAARMLSDGDLAVLKGLYAESKRSTNLEMGRDADGLVKSQPRKLDVRDPTLGDDAVRIDGERSAEAARGQDESHLMMSNDDDTWEDGVDEKILGINTLVDRSRERTKIPLFMDESRLRRRRWEAKQARQAVAMC